MTHKKDGPFQGNGGLMLVLVMISFWALVVVNFWASVRWWKMKDKKHMVITYFIAQKNHIVRALRYEFGNIIYTMRKKWLTDDLKKNRDIYI
jgi:hypothetical protein